MFYFSEVVKLSFKKMKTDEKQKSENDTENHDKESAPVVFEAGEGGESKRDDEDEGEDDDGKEEKEEVKPSTSSAAQEQHEVLNRNFTMKVSGMFKKPALPSSAASVVTTSKKSDTVKISALDKVRIVSLAFLKIYCDVY